MATQVNINTKEEGEQHRRKKRIVYAITVTIINHNNMYINKHEGPRGEGLKADVATS